MELRQVRYFVAVIDTGSFTAAAASLSIVQSAVSQQITRLERRLGTELFDRSRRTVRLTEAGRVFETYARAMLDIEAAAVSAVAEAPTPTVRIGIPTGAAASVAAALGHGRTGITETFELVSAPASTREMMVAAGDLDAAMTRNPPTRRGLRALELPDTELLLAASITHPAVTDDAIALSELASFPLVFDPDGDAVRAAATAVCRRVGFEPSVQLLSPGADALTAVTTIPGAWTAVYRHHAVALNSAVLGVRFVDCLDAASVPTFLVFRHDRNDLGIRIAASMHATTASSTTAPAG